MLSSLLVLTAILSVIIVPGLVLQNMDERSQTEKG